MNKNGHSYIFGHNHVTCALCGVRRSQQADEEGCPNGIDEERLRQMRSKLDSFHAHLEQCSQCRNHPFDLCAVGKNLLIAS